MLKKCSELLFTDVTETCSSHQPLWTQEADLMDSLERVEARIYSPEKRLGLAEAAAACI